MIALVDMDGTLADYNGAMTRDLAQLADPEVLADLGDLDFLERKPHMKARMDLIKRQPGWWAGLAKLPQGFQILDILRQLEYRIHILTRGPKTNINAWTEKAAWIRQHVPDYKGLTITLDKSLVYGKVLVDDWPPYVKGWLKHRPRGLVIMPDQPWNQGYEHPQVIRAQKDLTKVYEALAAQRKT